MNNLLSAVVVTALGLGVWLWLDMDRGVKKTQSTQPPPAATTRAAEPVTEPPPKAPNAPEMAAPEAPAPRMSENEFRDQLQSQFEKSYADGIGAEEAAAQADFLNGMLAGHKLDEEQKKQVIELQQEMSGALDRAGNEAQRERIYEEYAEKLSRLIGVPEP